jgi:hypothetical protein
VQFSQGALLGPGASFFFARREQNRHKTGQQNLRTLAKTISRV